MPLIGFANSIRPIFDANQPLPQIQKEKEVLLCLTAVQLYPYSVNHLFQTSIPPLIRFYVFGPKQWESS